MYFQGFEAHRWVDLVEIYLLDPSKSFAFDFWESTFAHARANNTAGLPGLRICNFGILGPLCVFGVFPRLRGPQVGRSCRDLSIGPLEKLRLRLSAAHFCISPHSNNTAGAPALRTWNFGILDILCVFDVFPRLRGPQMGRSCRDLSIGLLEKLRLRFSAAHFCIYPHK